MTTPKQRQIREWTAFVVLVLICVALTATFYRLGDIRMVQQEIRTEQEASKIRGLKLRAVGCRNIKLMGGGFEDNDPCLEPAMRSYFQPGG